MFDPNDSRKLRLEFPLPTEYDELPIESIGAALEERDRVRSRIATVIFRSLRKAKVNTIGQLLDLTWYQFGQLMGDHSFLMCTTLLERVSKSPGRYFTTSQLQERPVKNERTEDIKKRLRDMGMIE